MNDLVVRLLCQRINVGAAGLECFTTPTTRKVSEAVSTIKSGFERVEPNTEDECNST
jgi:hypothetical protein